MPSIHISEDSFEPYVLEHGGFQEAKQAIKQVVAENAPEVTDGV